MKTQTTSVKNLILHICEMQFALLTMYNCTDKIESFQSLAIMSIEKLEEHEQELMQLCESFE